MGFVLTEGSYDHNLVQSTKWEISSHFPQKLFWSRAPSFKAPGASWTRAEHTRSAALCTSSTHPKGESLGCITAPTDKLLQKKTLRKESWPTRKTLLLSDQCSDAGRRMKTDEGYICKRWATNAVFRVTTENWHEQMPPDMPSVPRNATGENWQNRQSLA